MNLLKPSLPLTTPIGGSSSTSISSKATPLFGDVGNIAEDELYFFGEIKGLTEEDLKATVVTLVQAEPMGNPPKGASNLWHGGGIGGSNVNINIDSGVGIGGHSGMGCGGMGQGGGPNGIGGGMGGIGGVTSRSISFNGIHGVNGMFSKCPTAIAAVAIARMVQKTAITTPGQLTKMKTSTTMVVTNHNSFLRDYSFSQCQCSSLQRR